MLRERGEDAALQAAALTRGPEHAAILANNLMDAATGLDTVFRAVVGNTNQIASQVDGIEQWGAELIGVAGEYGKIDDLLRRVGHTP